MPVACKACQSVTVKCFHASSRFCRKGTKRGREELNLSSHRRMEKNIHLSPMRLFFFFFRKIIFESTIAQRYCTTNGRGRRLRAILFPKEKEGERERACNVFINEIEGKLSDGKQRESDERCVGAGNRRSPASNSGRICTSKRRDNDFPPSIIQC